MKPFSIFYCLRDAIKLGVKDKLIFVPYISYYLVVNILSNLYPSTLAAGTNEAPLMDQVMTILPLFIVGFLLEVFVNLMVVLLVLKKLKMIVFQSHVSDLFWKVLLAFPNVLKLDMMIYAPFFLFFMAFQFLGTLFSSFILDLLILPIIMLFIPLIVLYHFIPIQVCLEQKSALHNLKMLIGYFKQHYRLIIKWLLMFLWIWIMQIYVIFLIQKGASGVMMTMSSMFSGFMSTIITIFSVLFFRKMIQSEVPVDKIQNASEEN